MPIPFPSAFYRIALLAWAWVLVSCSQVGDGPDGGPRKVYPPEVDPRDEAAAVFHPDSLHHFELTVADSLWDWLNRHAVEEQYVPGSLRAMGKEWKNVGIRYKGGYGTLRLCIDAQGNLVCDKLSLKVSLDEYEKGQRLLGLERLNFHSMVRDPTKLHERLAGQLFRAMGIPASRSAHATLSVNGKSLGLFTLVEQIDDRFAESRFPRSGDGILYKEVWPQGIDPGPYLAARETHKQDGDVSPMIRFAGGLQGINAGNHRSVLDESIDVGYLLQYLAVDQVITNWDGATTFYCVGENCRPHNHYWYQDEPGGRLWLIPWDLDATFGAASVFAEQPDWNDLTLGCMSFRNVANTPLRSAACDPLFQAMARYYPGEYREAVRKFLDQAFFPDRLGESLDRWSSRIEPELEKDPTRKQGMAQWKTEVRRLKESLQLLEINARRRVQELPIHSFGLSLAAVNGFEDWLPVAVEGAIASYTNPKSEVGHSLNAALALAGTHDYRLGFVCRNESDDTSGAWKQYVTSHMPFPRGSPTDLRGVRKVRFTAKADSARIVRLDIASARYTFDYSGKFFGWDVPMGAEPREFTLDFADLSLPSWGGAVPDSLQDILQFADGLQWSTNVTGRDWTTGLLPPGKEDAGYIQVDEIQFMP